MPVICIPDKYVIQIPTIVGTENNTLLGGYEHNTQVVNAQHFTLKTKQERIIDLFFGSRLNTYDYKYFVFIFYQWSHGVTVRVAAF